MMQPYLTFDIAQSTYLPPHTVILFPIQKVQQLYASQNECEKKQQLLVKVRQSCEQEVERQRLKHAETVESTHQKHSKRLKLMQGQLRNKERYLNEHRLFVRVSLHMCIIVTCTIECRNVCSV